MFKTERVEAKQSLTIYTVSMLDVNTKTWWQLRNNSMNFLYQCRDLHGWGTLSTRTNWIVTRKFLSFPFLTTIETKSSILKIWLKVTTGLSPAIKLVTNYAINGAHWDLHFALPWSGTSVGLIMRRICSIDCRSGDKPGSKPWKHLYIFCLCLYIFKL